MHLVLSVADPSCLSMYGLSMYVVEVGIDERSMKRCSPPPGTKDKKAKVRVCNRQLHEQPKAKRWLEATWQIHRAHTFNKQRQKVS
jgi:hypothetical protein